MTPRAALETAQDAIRALRKVAEAKRGGQIGSASLGSDPTIRAEVGAYTNALGVLHIMIGKLSAADITITQNQISEARSRAISPANTPRLKGVR